MKILLINSNREVNPWAVIPLGLSYIASILKKAQYSVNVLDLCFTHFVEKKLRKTLKDIQPDAIGITIRNIDNVNMCNSFFYLKPIKEQIVDVCKKYSSAPIILGGSAIGISPETVMDYFNVIYAVAGDGEEAILQWIKAIENDAEPQPAERLYYFRDEKGNIIKPGRISVIPFAQQIHPKPFQWINFPLYQKRSATVNIQTKRGCVFNCIYCSYNVIEGKRYRLREPDDVVDEVEEWISAANPKEFDFVDSIFNSPPDHAISICEEIIRRNINKNFTTMGLNPGVVSKELLFAMKKAGFQNCMCSPDSASPSIIHNLKKNFNRTELEKTAELFKNQGFRTFWFFILGAPGETKKTVQETLNFCKEFIPPEDVVHFTIGFRVFPNTELEKINISENLLKSNNDLLKPTFYYSPQISPIEILQMVHSEAKSNFNFITYFDMEIYDGLKSFMEKLFWWNPPDHSWIHVPHVNTVLSKLKIRNRIHHRHRARFHLPKD